MMLLDKEMIDGCQRLIHQIKIINGLRGNVLQGHVGEIEWAAIALPPIGTLDHRAGNWKTVHAADERSMRIEATATVLQEHTGRGCVNDPPRVSRLETSQQVLPHLWSEINDCLREMMGLNGKDRKLLVAASVTASLTGDLRWVALTNSLPKGINARHQALVLFVGVGHRRRLLMAFASLLLDERLKQECTVSVVLYQAESCSCSKS
jgi:hypothetical protein